MSFSWLFLFRPGYEDGTGTSGSTYKLGVFKATERTSPALFFYENVGAACCHPKDEAGKRLSSPVEAGIFEQRIRTWNFYKYRFNIFPE